MSDIKSKEAFSASRELKTDRSYMAGMSLSGRMSSLACELEQYPEWKMTAPTLWEAHAMIVALRDALKKIIEAESANQRPGGGQSNAGSIARAALKEPFHG